MSLTDPTPRAPDPRAPDPRAAARLAWARAATGDSTLELHRASADAGFRSYWRGGLSSRHANDASARTAPANAALASVIVMDSPPQLEDPRPWLRIRGLLEAGGVRVPGVLAHDVEAGFLLLEDLGTETYLHVIDAGNADALFDDAVTQLLRIQAIGCTGLSVYDAAFLARELHLFDEWFLGRHLGIALGHGDREPLEQVYRHLIDNALAQPQVFVHRDFMPRNLMPVAGGPAVIDFQDALRGPIAYDAISLFRDAFLSWPEERVEYWLRRYHERAAAAGLPVPAYERFRRDVDWIGVQRHVKVLGVFARLHYRDGKSKYLADAPRFLSYLDSVLPRYPELGALAEIIDQRVRPALQERAGA